MSKRGKQIKINISNRALYSLIAILVGLLIAGIVYAYNPSGSGGNPEIMGHSADEIEGAVGGGTFQCTAYTVQNSDIGKTSDQICATSSSVCVSLFHSYGSYSTGEECSHTITSYDVSSLGIVKCCKVV